MIEIVIWKLCNWYIYATVQSEMIWLCVGNISYGMERECNLFFSFFFFYLNFIFIVPMVSDRIRSYSLPLFNVKIRIMLHPLEFSFTFFWKNLIQIVACFIYIYIYLCEEWIMNLYIIYKCSVLFFIFYFILDFNF